MFRKIIFVLMTALPFLCHSQSEKVFWYKRPPGDTTFNLCGTGYHFYDSTGYYISGCENHLTFLGKFIYHKDSSTVYCDFVQYSMYDPLLKVFKKNIPGKREISVRVFDLNGEPCMATIGIVKLGRKKDTLTKQYYPHDYGQAVQLPYKHSKNTFWTIADLYPIFFAELHFPFEKKYNYYEIYIDLPRQFFYVTEGKIWVGGKLDLSIVNETHFRIGKDNYECSCK